MASPVLILNPRKRRMPAALRKYWASHGRRSRRRNPRSYRRRRHRAHREHRVRRRRNPSYRRRYRARSHRRPARRYRNPMGGRSGDLLSSYLVPGVLGAVGAVGFDVLWGYVEPQLPASFQGGWVATLAELITLWFGIKALDSMLPRYRQTIHRAGLGAATVIAYNVVEGLAAQYLPAGTPGLGGYMPQARYSMGQLGRVVGPNRMAGYMPRTVGGLRGLQDLYSPAATIQPNAPQQFAGVGCADDSFGDD